MKAVSDTVATLLCRSLGCLLNAGRYTDVAKLMARASQSKWLRKYCNKYPALGLSVSTTEVASLRALLPPGGAVPPQTRAVANTVTDPLAKLLYALVWKNAAVDRLPHMLQGVEDVYAGRVVYPAGSGMIMYQFGRSLADPTEPIVDQHTLRALRLISTLATGGKVNASTRRDPRLTSDHLVTYRAWVRALPSAPNHMRIIDQALFFLGKACNS